MKKKMLAVAAAGAPRGGTDAKEGRSWGSCPLLSLLIAKALASLAPLY
jgi:hypothetical protein